MRITIRSKLLVLITVLVIASCLSVGLRAYQKASNSLTNAVLKTVTEVTDAAAQEIKDRHDAEFLLLHSLAELPNIRSDEIHLTEKSYFLKNIYDKNPEKYENLAFYSKYGDLMLPDGSVIQLPNKPYIEVPVKTGKTYILDPYLSPVNNAVIMFMSVPVYNFDNEATGCLVSVIQGNVLNDIALSIDVAPGYHPKIINHETKEVIANGLEGEENINDIAEKREDPVLLATIDKVKAAPGSVLIYTDDETGVKMVGSYKEVEGYNWSVFCAAPYDSFFSDLVDLRKQIVLVMLLAIVIGLALGFIVIGVALRPLSTVRKSFETISGGNADLTQRIPETLNDEVGDVVKGFNGFTEKLQSIMTELKSSKEDLTKAGVGLQQSTFDTSSAITQIIANIQSVHKQIDRSGENVSNSASAVNEVAANIQSLEQMIEKQNAGISEASAVIEQMIANIGQVNDYVDMMNNSFTELSNKTDEGSHLQISVNEKIEEIRNQSKTLQEANKVIASIASKTNLLAMNAAIEASHAGEAGKGFSVVADEIRKLSENSSTQSTTIGNQLDKIRNSIEDVVAESENSRVAFRMITEKINETDHLVQKIRNSMEQQTQGSIQINKALQVVNDSSLEVRDASKEMTVGNKAILDEMQRLQDVTTEITSSMEEMAIGAGKINTTGESLNEISNKINNTIADIGNQIDLFRI